MFTLCFLKVYPFTPNKGFISVQENSNEFRDRFLLIEPQEQCNLKKDVDESYITIGIQKCTKKMQ